MTYHEFEHKLYKEIQLQNPSAKVHIDAAGDCAKDVVMKVNNKGKIYRYFPYKLYCECKTEREQLDCIKLLAIEMKNND